MSLNVTAGLLFPFHLYLILFVFICHPAGFAQVFASAVVFYGIPGYANERTLGLHQLCCALSGSFPAACLLCPSLILHFILCYPLEVVS